MPGLTRDPGEGGPRIAQYPLASGPSPMLTMVIMPTGVLGYPFQFEASLEGLVVCNSLIVNGYDWTFPTISDPNRICKKFT